MNPMVTALLHRERRVKPGHRATLDPPPRYVRFTLVMSRNINSKDSYPNEPREQAVVGSADEARTAEDEDPLHTAPVSSGIAPTSVSGALR
jgi:hypothetical protein